MTLTKFGVTLLLLITVVIYVQDLWAASDDRKEPEESVPHEAESPSRLSSEAIPLQLNDVPDRPRLLPEVLGIPLGDTFLGTGPLGKEFTLPTGAVWRPSLWIFGQLRTAVQTFDNGITRNSEWANRLDLFGNLKLSASERILIGFRPLDQDGNFTSYEFEPNTNARGEWNANINTLFFEGDFGEIFPNLDVADTKALDLGFSVGRQPLFFQNGQLIQDIIESIGITRNNLLIPGASNVRVTALYGWNNVNRDDNDDDQSAQLFGLFTETDFAFSTVDIDLVFVEAPKSTGDAFFVGASGIQRIGPLNTTFQVNSSFPLDGETPQTSRGTLLFGETSWTPPHTHDILYLNAFWGIDQFSSAARDFAAGGPLGRVGILFEAVGLGRYGSALSNRANDAAGGSLGYQMFFEETRKQLIVEIGGRDNTHKTPVVANRGAAAVAARYQQAFGQHLVVQFDSFGSIQEDRNPGFGGRLECRINF
jgi:hypothetical protein